MKAKSEMTLNFFFRLFPAKIDFSLLISGSQGDDIELWKVYASPLVDVPKHREKVFYFPQSHME
jgi:hypothetical protein